MGETDAMSQSPNRPRRPASAGKLRAIRILGWRYSATRGAWVHRAFKGRVGPVYVDPDHFLHLGVTEHVEFKAARPFRPSEVDMLEAQPPLPQRPLPPKVPAERTKVKVRLSETEEPRTVVVDGKPPVRGVPVDSLRTTSAVVVPIRSARATG